jgi:hypothetical protein
MMELQLRHRQIYNGLHKYGYECLLCNTRNYKNAIALKFVTTLFPISILVWKRIVHKLMLKE